jgi:hypothetical protein
MSHKLSIVDVTIAGHEVHLTEVINSRTVLNHLSGDTSISKQILFGTYEDLGFFR